MKLKKKLCNKLILLILTLILVDQSKASIIEFKNKNLNLLFDDINYRFTLQRELIPSKEFSKELLFFNVPPTSYVTLMIDKVSYTLNEGNIINSPTVTKDGNLSLEVNIQGIGIKLTSKFIPNSYSQEEDALEIEVEIANLTNFPRNVGIRYLLDTVFGENEPKPKFYLDGKTSIDYELAIDQNNMISYIVSSSDINGVNNLYIYWNKTPSKIIFSNWRKLNTVNWDLKPSPFLNYRFSETSGEDCAVAIFFENITLNPKTKENISIILSANPYLPKILEIKPKEEVAELEKTPQEALPTAPQQNIVFVTNVIVLTNQYQTAITQEIRSTNEILRTNIVTLTNLKFDSQFIENEKMLKRISEIEEKLENLSISIEKTFDKITNLLQQNKEQKDTKDIEELKKIKVKMAKLSKTIDTIEERISMINKYIEIRKKFSDKRVIVYSQEEYKKDIKIIEEISEILNQIMNEILLNDTKTGQ